MRVQALGAGLIAQTQSALPPFTLFQPSTAREAVFLLDAHPDAVIAAGCSDLVAQIREGLEPTTLIALQRIPELRSISFENGELRLGSMVTHYTGSTNSEIQRAVPGLAEAWGSIATVRIRYRATLGGNLLARRYRYELSVILSALDGFLEFQTGSGVTKVSVASIWEDSQPGSRRAHAPEAALLTAVTVDTRSLLWYGYDRSMRPVMTLSLAVRRLGDRTLAVQAACGSEYRQPFLLAHTARAASVSDLDGASISRALAAQLPEDAGDYSGSVEYRRHLIATLATRLLAEAAAAQDETRTP